MPAPKCPYAVVVQRAAIAQRHADHRLLGGRGRLGDRLGHFLRLAMAEADTALAVADHDQRREAEALAALHRLGDAVDVDQLLDELLAAVAGGPPRPPRLRPWPPRLPPGPPRSPPRAAAIAAGAAPAAAAAAGAAATWFHPPFKTPVHLRGRPRPAHERGHETENRRDRRRPWKRPPPWRARRGACRHRPPPLGRAGRCRAHPSRASSGGDRDARAVVDHLRIDVLRRAVDRQARALPGLGAERGADAPPPLLERERPLLITSSSLPCGRYTRRDT